MRIWTIHPKYLDAKGLVALWRETLLAKHVLEGKTKGYTNHPQLTRFKATTSPTDSINQYLSIVWNESKQRGYNFDSTKINWDFTLTTIPVTNKQFDYEITHILKKLKVRDIHKFNELQQIQTYIAHPMFTIVDGEIEDWEKV